MWEWTADCVILAHMSTCDSLAPNASDAEQDQLEVTAIFEELLAAQDIHSSDMIHLLVVNSTIVFETHISYSNL